MSKKQTSEAVGPEITASEVLERRCEMANRPLKELMGEEYAEKATAAAIKHLAETSPDKAREVAGLTDAIESAKGGTVEAKYAGIAVMGSHPATVQEGPFDHQDWLIYGCSPHNLEPFASDIVRDGRRYLDGGLRPDGGRYRVDEWFEVHATIPDETRPSSYTTALEHLKCPVWIRDVAYGTRIKHAQPYPERELKQRFGPFHFTSSIAFMLAKAIVDCERLNIPRIGIWGVMQASENEYTYQRPGIQYFIWEATRCGIHVIAPEVSKLFEPQRESF